MIIETRRTRASHQRASSSEGRKGLKVGLAAAGVITFLALAVIVFLWLLPPL
jgi:fatty acid desaturase